MIQIGGAKNIKLYSHIYYGDKAKQQKYKILWKLKHRKLMPKVYVITFPSNPLNLLDVYNYMELLQPYYRRRTFTVLGIAYGYEEALKIVEQIVGEVYKKTGNFKIEEYLSEIAKTKIQKERE